MQNFAQNRTYSQKSPMHPYVHTPKHGSWLNLVESAFSKMACTFLRHIRVESKDELKERILLGIKEFNETPVVYKWKKFNMAIA